MMVVCTGKRVVPGDVVYSTGCSDSSGSSNGSIIAGNYTTWDGVIAGEGCYLRVVSNSSSVEQAEELQIVAAKLGVVQWCDSTVSVLRVGKHSHESVQADAVQLSEPSDIISPSLLANSTTVFGPRTGDTVHLRVLRVSRAFAYGEIIAVNGVWCSNNSTSVGMEGTFRGVVHVEDIRPFKPNRNQLAPPPPSAAFQSGDVVVATVLSQSDVRQYQLSTIPEHCGVVESTVTLDHVRVQLLHIPGRRDAMQCTADGTVHSRWSPLIRLPQA